MLWRILAERGWSHARLAAELAIDGARAALLLYGERRPGRDLSLKLLAIGVPIELWSLPCPDGWLPSHADQTGPQRTLDEPTAEDLARSTGS